jgi:hypothetical protein
MNKKYRFDKKHPFYSSAISVVVFILYTIMLFTIIPKYFTGIQFFQNKIFARSSGLVFPLSTMKLCGLSLLLFIILSYIPILELPDTIFRKISYGKLKKSKKDSKKRKTDYILLILSGILCFTISIFTIFNHCRVNDEGIFFTKYFSLSETKLDWKDITNVSIFIIKKNEKYGRFSSSTIISPNMIIKTKKRDIEIWSQAWRNGYTENEIIYVLENIKKYTNIVLNVNYTIPEDHKNLFDNSSRKDEILNVFDYLRNNEK